MQSAWGPPRRRYLALAAFLAAFVWLGVGLGWDGLGATYCDPVSAIRAQDEAVYAHEAMRMARSGEWLTPVYLGRYALNKPPLLQWLAAASVRLWGVSPWSLRLPSAIAGAAVAAMLFVLAWRTYSAGAAFFVFVLLITDNLFVSFSRLCMTDMLLTCGTVAAMFVLARDPALERRRSVALFGLFAGAAIMAKGAAGCLALIALAVYAAWGGPRWKRVLAAFAAAAAVALPWHLYQFAAHPRWFVAEYILTQHLSVGVTAPPQYSSENHLLFYGRRLLFTDPALAAGALAALIPLLRRWRERKLLLAWGGVTVAALLAFRYRSAYYLLPLLPVMALAAGELYSALPREGRALVLALLVISFLAWGLPAREGMQLDAAPALERYCAMRRPNELIMIGAEDQFFASDLPLPRLRYCLTGPSQPSLLDFGWLGISVSVSDFERLSELRPVFRQRLASFGLHSEAPIATVIRAEDAAAVESLIERHAQTDFYIPGSMLGKLTLMGAGHRMAPAGAGMLLLAAGDDRQPSRPCGLGPAE